jgi:hypothetical protein
VRDAASKLSLFTTPLSLQNVDRLLELGVGPADEEVGRGVGDHVRRHAAGVEEAAIPLEGEDGAEA